MQVSIASGPFLAKGKTKEIQGAALSRLVTMKESDILMPKSSLSTSNVSSRLKEKVKSNEGTVHSDLYYVKEKKNDNGGFRRKPNAPPIPNAMEIAEIRSGARLYKTNLFRLETEKLLESCSVDYVKLVPLEHFLKDLKKVIDAMSPVAIEEPFTETYPFVYFVESPAKKKPSLAFTFRPPTRCDLVGSYLLKTVTRPNLNLDMAIEMPREMFDKKDYLNYRYFNKRTAYMAEVYKQLRKSFPYCESEENTQKPATRNDVDQNGNLPNDIAAVCKTFRPYFFLQPWQGDVHRPVIVLKVLIPRSGADLNETPSETSYKCSSWCIRLFAVPPRDIFSETRLAPNRNAVRFCSTATPQNIPELFEQGRKLLIAKPNAPLPPTPMYNASLLEDLRMRLWLERFHGLVASHSGFVKAVQLLKCWGSARGHCFAGWGKNTPCVSVSSMTGDSNPASGGDAGSLALISPVTGFLLTALTAHVCVSNGSGMRRADPIQITRMVLSFLADTDFTTRKVVFGRLDSLPLTEDERASGLKLLLDGSDSGNLESGIAPTEESLSYNILWRVQLALEELQSSARASLRALNILSNPFDVLFKKQTSDYAIIWDATLSVCGNTTAHKLPAEADFQESEQRQVFCDKRLRMLVEKSISGAKNAVTSTQETGSPFAHIHLEHPHHFQVAGALCRVLRRALTDRLSEECGLFVRFFCPAVATEAKKGPYSECLKVLQVPPFSWTNISHTPSFFKKFPVMNVLVGWRYNTATEQHLLGAGVSAAPWRLVDRGYPVNSPEAEAYKNFWGNATVRRFQDGSINQSVVWNQPTPAVENLGYVKWQNETVFNKGESKTSVLTYVPGPLSQIVQHILRRHFEEWFDFTITGDKAYCFKCKFGKRPKLSLRDAVLGTAIKPTLKRISPVDGLALCHPTQELSDLKELVMGITDLPLAVKDFRLSDASGLMTCTDAVLYSASKTPLYAPIIRVDCSLEFEKSGGWPVEREAVNWMKAALLNALREELVKASTVASARLGGGITQEGKKTLQAESPFLDVELIGSSAGTGSNLSSPFLIKPLFRIHVFHPVEHLALASVLTDATAPLQNFYKRPASETSATACAALARMWWRPRFNDAVYALSQESPIFSSTLRLAKMWASSHLFPLDVTSDLLTSLCLRLFRNREDVALRPPTSPHAGFLRVLQLLATHDWENEGLFVSYEKATEEEKNNSSGNQACNNSDWLDSLKAARQRSRDAFQQMRDTSGLTQCPNALRFPHFWVTSLDDPHCQLIRLPSISQSLALIQVARSSYQKALRFSADVVLQSNTDSSSGFSTSYTPPHLSFLNESVWAGLFKAAPPGKVFDIAVELQQDFLQSLTSDHLGSINEKGYDKESNGVQSDTSKTSSSFKNLSGDKVSFSEATTSPCVAGSLDEAAPIAESVTKVFQAFREAARYKQENPEVQPGLNGVVESVMAVPGFRRTFTGTHDAVAMMRDVFERWIEKLRQFLQGVGDVYYDPLWFPFPATVYIKLNASAWELRQATVANWATCPKDIVRRASRVSKDGEEFFELPHAVLLFSELYTLGGGLVKRIRLLP